MGLGLYTRHVSGSRERFGVFTAAGGMRSFICDYGDSYGARRRCRVHSSGRCRGAAGGREGRRVAGAGEAVRVG